MAKSKDLFDDTSMSFGEHLEVLRVHLWKAIIGLVICVVGALFFGDRVVAVVRAPIDTALRKHNAKYVDTAYVENIEGFDLWNYAKSFFGSDTSADPDTSAQDPTAVAISADPADRSTIQIKLKVSDLAALLHDFNPKTYPAPIKPADEKAVALVISADEFSVFHETAETIRKPITLNVQEAFLTYLKVAFVTGLLFASPWVFYQLWLFVAAGLYPHERKYVYIYLPMSITLFLGGAVFCFTLVFPYVLDFLLGFNKMLGVVPQIRLSEWITFAIMLPVMFGLSFQLPMVMLFLERISIFEAADYREKRRISILVIAIVSMLMTPADPMSMIMMMLPLLALYELGIVLCNLSPVQSPFETAEA